MAVTKGSTWSSLYDVDVEDTMTRKEALDAGIAALEWKEKDFKAAGFYSEATHQHGAAQILQRMWDEIDEADFKAREEARLVDERRRAGESP